MNSFELFHVNSTIYFKRSVKLSILLQYKVHTISFSSVQRLSAALKLFAIVSRYSKVDMSYWIKPRMKPPGGKHGTSIPVSKNKRVRKKKIYKIVEHHLFNIKRHILNNANCIIVKTRISLFYDFLHSDVRYPCLKIVISWF